MLTLAPGRRHQWNLLVVNRWRRLVYLVTNVRRAEIEMTTLAWLLVALAPPLLLAAIWTQPFSAALHWLWTGALSAATGLVWVGLMLWWARVTTPPATPPRGVPGWLPGYEPDDEE